MARRKKCANCYVCDTANCPMEAGAEPARLGADQPAAAGSPASTNVVEPERTGDEPADEQGERRGE